MCLLWLTLPLCISPITLHLTGPFTNSICDFPSVPSLSTFACLCSNSLSDQISCLHLNRRLVANNSCEFSVGYIIQQGLSNQVPGSPFVWCTSISIPLFTALAEVSICTAKSLLHEHHLILCTVLSTAASDSVCSFLKVVALSLRLSQSDCS